MWCVRDLIIYLCQAALYMDSSTAYTVAGLCTRATDVSTTRAGIVVFHHTATRRISNLSDTLPV